MKPCPTCGVALEPAEYERIPVLRCSRCNGHLVRLPGLKAIKNRAFTPAAELRAEVTACFKGSTDAKLKCPHCRRSMEKRLLSTHLPQVRIDLCDRCGQIWFEGGELAIAQLHHEAGPAFQDYQQSLARMRDLLDSPERLAEYERNCRKLPDDPGPFDDLPALAVDTLLSCLLRGIPRR
jgi:Zn-finger nucleic acid-binding protein